MTGQEYLVRITVALPAEMPAERKAELAAAELRRGRELRAEGAIDRIWRLPGQTANVGVWIAESASHLHELISSLPLYPWLSVDVSPLAVHPVEADLP